MLQRDHPRLVVRPLRIVRDRVDQSRAKPSHASPSGPRRRRPWRTPGPPTARRTPARHRPSATVPRPRAQRRARATFVLGRCTHGLTVGRGYPARRWSARRRSTPWPGRWRRRGCPMRCWSTWPVSRSPTVPSRRRRAGRRSAAHAADARSSTRRACCCTPTSGGRRSPTTRRAGHEPRARPADAVSVGLATRRRPLLARLCGAEDGDRRQQRRRRRAARPRRPRRGRERAGRRGESVEIGGGFRLPEVMEQSGARLVDVGTTNRTRLPTTARASDRPAADVAIVLKVHPSNYRVDGFVEDDVRRRAGDAGCPRRGRSRQRAVDAMCPWWPGPTAGVAGGGAGRPSDDRGRCRARDVQRRQAARRPAGGDHRRSRRPRRPVRSAPADPGRCGPVVSCSLLSRSSPSPTSAENVAREGAVLADGRNAGRGAAHAGRARRRGDRVTGDRHGRRPRSRLGARDDDPVLRRPSRR